MTLYITGKSLPQTTAFFSNDIWRNMEQAPVLFQGIGHSLNPSNSLVLKVLSASPSAYSADPKSKLSSPPSLTGSSISLVSIVQARNSARVLITGSLSMFSSRFFKSGVHKVGSPTRHDKSGNERGHIKGRYFTSLKVHVYGVFQFKVEYEKFGYTSFSLSKQITGFFIFTAVHLFSK